MIPYSRSWAKDNILSIGGGSGVAIVGGNDDKAPSQPMLALIEYHADTPPCCGIHRPGRCVAACCTLLLLASLSLSRSYHQVDSARGRHVPAHILLVLIIIERSAV